MTEAQAAPSTPARLWALGQIVIATIALFAAGIAIALVAAPFLPEALRMPVQALAMWGAVGAGWLFLRGSKPKSSYRELGLAKPTNWLRTLLWTLAAIVVAQAGASALHALIAAYTDWPALDVAYIRNSIQGDTLAYVAWMVLVVWGSAGLGEELFGRGFVFDRFQIAFGRRGAGLIAALIAQAALFGILHAVQGPIGIVITAYVGLVFAAIYLLSGRNLWAVILAHGLVDSYALTLMYLGVPIPGLE